MALLDVMHGMELTAVPHGFRSAFSSWVASSTAYPPEVREMALGHTLGSDLSAHTSVAICFRSAVN
jgi:integrase